ncbi:membrane protein [Pilimelia terevasa]|uniref:Membrane protein n=1 Tax=Pilimelia terevasa TaxID=53372 RepID=A0A8J3BUH9_9ACTN|nr:type II secretion system F family protein [Pilimelia terevasa]GGK36821.1 membrane protein [Pilimelia terevasa]
MDGLFLPAMASGAVLAASVFWLAGLLTGRIRPTLGPAAAWARRVWAGPRRGGVRQRRIHRRRLTAAAVAALVVLAVSGMPVAALLTVLAVVGLPWLLGAGRLEAAAIERLEAVESWTRRLKDLVETGTGLQQGIISSATTAGPEIAVQVRGLAMALQAGQDLPTALRRLAGQLDDPHADEVIVALIAHAQVRGSRLGDVLDGIAAAAAEQASIRRAVHAERANARLTLKVLTAMVLAEFALGVLAPAYAAPYATATGQVVLALFSAAFIGLLLAARRLALPSRPARILALDPGGVR